MVIASNKIVESNFNLQDTEQYNLSILVGKDRLCYLVTNATKHLLLLESFVFDCRDTAELLVELESQLSQIELLKRTFAKRLVLVYTPIFTYIPAALFVAGEEKIYLSSQTALGEEQLCFSHSVGAKKIQIVFALEKPLVQFLSTHFVGIEFQSLNAAILRGAKLAYANEEKWIMAHIDGRTLRLLSLNKGKFIFQNVFHFTNAEDCLYYLLLAYKQLGLSPESQLLHLAGEIIPDSEIYKLIHRYIRNIQFVERPPFFIYGPELCKLPAHLFFDLYCCQLCVLSVEN